MVQNIHKKKRHFLPHSCPWRCSWLRGTGPTWGNPPNKEKDHVKLVKKKVLTNLIWLCGKSRFRETQHSASSRRAWPALIKNLTCCPLFFFITLRLGWINQAFDWKGSFRLVLPWRPLKKAVIQTLFFSFFFSLLFWWPIKRIETRDGARLLTSI